MSPRKSLSVASLPAPPLGAVKRPKAGVRHRRKGNSQTEMTRSELEEMVLEAARMRAVNARSRSGG